MSGFSFDCQKLAANGERRAEPGKVSDPAGRTDMVQKARTCGRSRC